MRGRNRNIFYFILLAGLLAIIWASYKSFNVAAAPTDKTTSELIQAADSHSIKQATIKGNGTEVDWTDNSGKLYKTTFRDTYQIETKLLEDNVPFSTEQPSSSNLLLSVILPNVILFSSSAVSCGTCSARRRAAITRPSPSAAAELAC